MVSPLDLGIMEIEIIDELISIPYIEMMMQLMGRFGIFVAHNSSLDRFPVLRNPKFKCVFGHSNVLKSLLPKAS